MDEVIFYGIYNDTTAREFVERMTELKGKDVRIRLNTVGGSVAAGAAMLRSLREHDGKISIAVEGGAHSMGAFMLLFATDRENTNWSSAVVHRAANFSEDMDVAARQLVINSNVEARKQMEATVNIPEFLRIGSEQLGIDLTLDRFFDHTSAQVDVTLNAEQMRSLGFVDRTMNLSSGEVTAIHKLAAAAGVAVAPMKETKPPKASTTEDRTKTKIMNIDELQSQHPALYKQVFEAGQQAALETERDRVQAHLEFYDSAPEDVTKAIVDGKKFTSADAAKYSKAMAVQALAMEEENPDTGNDDQDGGDEGDVATARATAASAKQQQDQEKVKTFVGDVRAELGLKDKTKKTA